MTTIKTNKQLLSPLPLGNGGTLLSLSQQQTLVAPKLTLIVKNSHYLASQNPSTNEIVMACGSLEVMNFYLSTFHIPLINYDFDQFTKIIERKLNIANRESIFENRERLFLSIVNVWNMKLGELPIMVQFSRGDCLVMARCYQFLKTYDDNKIELITIGKMTLFPNNLTNYIAPVSQEDVNLMISKFSDQVQYNSLITDISLVCPASFGIVSNTCEIQEPKFAIEEFSDIDNPDDNFVIDEAKDKINDDLIATLTPEKLLLPLEYYKDIFVTDDDVANGVNLDNSILDQTWVVPTTLVKGMTRDQFTVISHILRNSQFVKDLQQHNHTTVISEVLKTFVITDLPKDMNVKVGPEQAVDLNIPIHIFSQINPIEISSMKLEIDGQFYTLDQLKDLASALQNVWNRVVRFVKNSPFIADLAQTTYKHIGKNLTGFIKKKFGLSDDQATFINSVIDDGPSKFPDLLKSADKLKNVLCSIFPNLTNLNRKSKKTSLVPKTKGLQLASETIDDEREFINKLPDTITTKTTITIVETTGSY
ncbi:hypothetical protein 3 [Wuhan heteroptera virus 3]|uniref:hypothetical protein 3 n=1 Tax=Wuhan heteroptera virus 3 TaxID=1923703 RepID=UPI00090BD62B|nr:hypothetical protein 3 [Wuhan heteroptera virus 3]APG79071.1 hypothetical protein 3 [Wuhan heteroptera virus 3]APG79207.1 hypothetical protein 3 [Wuhan heteroptera virus 3]